LLFFTKPSIDDVVKNALDLIRAKRDKVMSTLFDLKIFNDLA
jgi:hypothetical protein